MERLHRLVRALLRALLPADLRDPVIGDLDDEMAERIRAGAVPRDAAAWAVRQACGSLPHALGLRLRPPATARHGTPPGGHAMGFPQDVQYALRLLRKTPLVTGAAIGTLALGIGATTAIFSVVQAALLRDLPFHEPDRIVSVYESYRSTFRRMVINPSNFDYWERHAASFSGLAAMRASSVTLTGAGEAARVRLQAVTPAAFFDVLRVSPAIGRRLTDADAAGTAPAVLLSHGLWSARFGGDPEIVSRTITLNGIARPIAGVMPQGFRFPHETDLWQALVLPPEDRANSRSWYLGVVARLAPGVEVADAQAELDVLARRLQEAFPARQKDRGAWVVSLHEDLVENVEEGLAILQGAAALVLFVAVGNVASLLLARCSTRGREFGIRAAVGASRARIVRQLLTESLLLGVAGAAGGVLLARSGVRALVAISPLQLPPGMEPSIGGPVLAFALGAGLVTSVLFGLAPALFASRAGVPARDDSPSSGAAPRIGRLRSALVVAEVGLAVVLLVGAGLLMRSFAQLMAQEVGFTGERVVTADVQLPAWEYDTAGKRRQFWNTLFERLHATPGVEAAAGSTALPFSNWEWQTSFRIVGQDDERPRGTSIRTIHPRYFETLGIPFLQGRGLTGRDGAGSEPVVVVNEVFVRTHLDGRDPIGTQVRFVREPESPAATIVGVAGNTRHYRLTEPPGPEMYRPLAQSPPQHFVLAIKSAGDPASTLSSIRAAIRDLDRDVTVERLATMPSLVARTVADRRFYLTLMSFFSLVAVALAMIGVYSVLAYVVGLRTREIGIRMALGAAPRQIRRGVLRSGGALIAAGLALGAGGALAAAQILRSLLFGVTPRDPLTLAAAAGLLGLLGLAAAYAPARRAGRLDPTAALRQD